MKVAVVCPYAFDSHGGVQDQVARIVSWLRAGGDEAWAVAPGSGGPDGTRHVGRHRSLPVNRSRAPIALSPRVVRRVSAAVADADVVHIHEPFMPLVSVGAVLADTPPKVGTFHADPGRVARTAYRGGAVLLRWVSRRLDVVTAVSEVAAAALGSIAEPRIVPNGIDLEAYAPAGTKRVAGRVVFVGRDEPRKGLDVLLQAWPAIVAAHPGATVHVIGAERTAPPAGVAFLGRVDEARKAAELTMAEVMVAPNLGGESFGIVVVEGLASGCAVVASDIVAFQAVAGDAARFFPAGNAPALAEAVVSLLGARPEREALGERGRWRAARFGRDRVLAGYMEAYEQARAARGTGRDGRRT